MDNKTIARHFDLLAKLMELHEENPFKIKSYSNAYQQLRRLDVDLHGMEEGQLMQLDGIGKAIAQKIRELLETGRIETLENIKQKTPEGLLDILKIKGLGAKKIRLIWKDLDVSTIGELEYACLENRLISIKGFGQKTQDSILEQIAFLKKSEGSVLLPEAIRISELLLTALRAKFSASVFSETGLTRRKMDIVDIIEILGTADRKKVEEFVAGLDEVNLQENRLYADGVRFTYHQTDADFFAYDLLVTTGPAAFIADYQRGVFENESEAVQSKWNSFVPPECRDLALSGSDQIKNFENLVKNDDIQGVIHAHSRWSDGIHTIEQMAGECANLGYSYMIMTDHSVSAFYANGLTEERVEAQWAEIDTLNSNNPEFKIFKGIESDILYTGDLDYRDDLLKQFDVVIASVHSGLKMDVDKANERLIKAIENPSTRILGHLTGRLLLGRPGYPVDHPKIIDACAANGVAIEINSNPYRLDLDWRWLPYALEKGVLLAISPDAHNMKGIQDIKYGVWMARKGLVPGSSIINSKNSTQFEDWISQK